jgi:multidrug efflux pump subunit AcrA (membrane-fusion protein)
MVINMNEKSVKRREWVKNIAIIFLSVMLVLTFFSNTIMNYSLPEVATQYVSSGSITSKIRGTGNIVASDPYNVVIKSGRVIESVKVKVGDQVEKDQVLFLLEESESTELTEAQKVLDELTLAYEKALLGETVDNSVINAVESGETTTMEQFKKDLKAANTKVTNAETAVKSKQAEIDAVQKSLDLLSAQVVDTKAEQQAVVTATTNLNNANSNLTSIKNTVAYHQSIYDGYAAVRDAAKTVLDAAIEVRDDAYTALQTALGDVDPSNDAAAQATYDAAVADVATKQADYDAKAAVVTSYTSLATEKAKLPAAQLQYDNCVLLKLNADNALAAKVANTAAATQKAAYDAQIKQLNAQLTELNSTLKSAQEAKTKLLINSNLELDFKAKVEAIAKQQEVVDKLVKDNVDGQITAPVAGTITSVNFVAGQTTTPEAVMAVIQMSDKGYTLEFSVTNEQAKKVSIGDPAELVNAWYYYDLKATLSAIKADPNNPGKNKILSFDVTGEVTAGQSLTLSVGEKSANYDLIVPNSAIREDNNGKFVLIVEQKSSPLGNRYVATRIDVEVLASDDTQTAISAALYGYEYVITTSTKPVEAGKLVRLAE